MDSRAFRVPVTLTMLALSWTLGASPAAAAIVGNPACPGEEVFFDPGNGEDIVVPDGYLVSVFARGLNFPTAVAFRGNKQRFEVFVLESGHGLPSRCNDEELMVFGGLIIFFLIVEPRGLARLWQITKEKLRLWPFPH